MGDKRGPKWGVNGDLKSLKPFIKGLLRVSKVFKLLKVLKVVVQQLLLLFSFFFKRSNFAQFSLKTNKALTNLSWECFVDGFVSEMICGLWLFLMIFKNSASRFSDGNKILSFFLAKGLSILTVTSLALTAKLLLFLSMIFSFQRLLITAF